MTFAALMLASIWRETAFRVPFDINSIIPFISAPTRTGMKILAWHFPPRHAEGVFTLQPTRIMRIITKSNVSHCDVASTARLQSRCASNKTRPAVLVVTSSERARCHLSRRKCFFLPPFYFLMHSWELYSLGCDSHAAISPSAVHAHRTPTTFDLRAATPRRRLDARHCSSRIIPSAYTHKIHEIPLSIFFCNLFTAHPDGFSWRSRQGNSLSFLRAPKYIVLYIAWKVVFLLFFVSDERWQSGHFYVRMRWFIIKKSDLQTGDGVLQKNEIFERKVSKFRWKKCSFKRQTCWHDIIYTDWFRMIFVLEGPAVMADASYALTTWLVMVILLVYSLNNSLRNATAPNEMKKRSQSDD